MRSRREDRARPITVWFLEADGVRRRSLEAAFEAASLAPEFRGPSDPLPPAAGPGAPDCLVVCPSTALAEAWASVGALRHACPTAALLLAVESLPGYSLAAARRAGAFDVIGLPAAPEALEAAVQRAAEVGALRRRNAELERRREAGARSSLLVGGSAAIARLRAGVATAAACAGPVLIVGECGSGKGRVAQALHAASPRRNEPFVKLPCAAVPLGMMLGELFGTERAGAAGAVVDRRGRLERAGRGSLLLEEIEELSLALQPKLAEACRCGRVVPIGGTRRLQLEARLLATTSCDLGERVQAGRFSAELFDLLSGATLRVPPLRDRREDIPILAADLLEERAVAEGTTPLRLTPEAVGLLIAHDWPGNVRELRNVLERAALLCPGPELGAEHIVLGPEPGRRRGPDREPGGQTLRERERAWILQVLRETRGNRSAAARRLGVSARTIRNKIAEYRADAALSGDAIPGESRRAAREGPAAPGI